MIHSDRVILFRNAADSTPAPDYPHFVSRVVVAGRCVMLAYVELYADELERLQSASPEAQSAFALALQDQVLAAFDQSHPPINPEGATP